MENSILGFCMNCLGMNSKSKTPRTADSGDGGGVVAAVNDDELTEILVRLPAKSVTRFKLVCKHWLSLISPDQFRRLHTLRRHKPQPSLLLRICERFFYLNPYMTNGDKPMIVLHNFTLPNPKILSSCNGLMLLRCDYHVYINRRSDYYVYNPTTKQSRKINLDYDSEYPRIKGLNLAFDPSKSPHYKIVFVRGCRKAIARTYRIEVYDSVSHTWKPCLEERITDSINNINFSCGVHWNNSIYWKTSDALIYFDIDKNVIKFLQIPWLDHQTWAFCVYELQESNGHLYLFAIDHKGESLALWELQLRGDHDHSHEWFFKYMDLPRLEFGTWRIRWRGDDDERFTHLCLWQDKDLQVS